MNIITDENGKIIAVKKIPSMLVSVSESSEIINKDGGINGYIGNEAMCYADHIHPYGYDLRNDADFQAVDVKAAAALSHITSYINEKAFDILVIITKIGVEIVGIYLIITREIIELLPSFISAFRTLIKLLRSLGVKEIEDEDGNKYDTDEMIDNLES